MFKVREILCKVKETVLVQGQKNISGARPEKQFVARYKKNTLAQPMENKLFWCKIRKNISSFSGETLLMKVKEIRLLQGLKKPTGARSEKCREKIKDTRPVQGQ